jgi:TP901 family phage tail tape measure protein
MGAATEMVVDTMKGFQIGFENTTHVTDVMAKAVTSSNMTFAQLGTALSYVSGVAKMANNTLEETTAAIAQMADVGIKGSRAGVYMRTGLLRLMAPQAAARKELEKFGVSIYTAEGKMKPFIQIVGELGEALRGATEEQRNMAFKALFGQRAITGQIAVFRKGRAELEKFTDMLRNAGGTAQEIADKQLGNLSAQFGRLIKIVMDTAYAISKALGPALREAVADLQTQFKKLNEFFKKHELVIAKYALKGYRYFKAFGGGVIDIIKDISQNWDERWAFMVKAVRIQVKAARDIIAATFDDVWATLKDGAIAYGKTLYEVFRKTFTDIAMNMKGWAWAAIEKWGIHKGLYDKYRKEENAALVEQGVNKLPLNEYTKAFDDAAKRAKERADKEFRVQQQTGAFDHLEPKVETESWADIGEKIKEHWVRPYEDAKNRLGGILEKIVEIEKEAAAEIGKAMPEAWKNRWADLRAELAEIDSDIEFWYKKQKKAASDATKEIAGLAKAREDLDAGLGGKLTAETETKEEKTVSFVGVKEAWQRMVESIYSPQTKMLSQQTSLLADIDTGQADIVDAVQGVEAAVKKNFAGGAEADTPTQAPDAQQSRAEGRRERRYEKDEAKEGRITEGLRERRERREERVEKGLPQTDIEKDDKRIRQEIAERKRERDDAAALEEHKREYPDWKPAELQIKAPEIQAPGSLEVETPKIQVPQIEIPQVSKPVIPTEQSRAEQGQTGRATDTQGLNALIKEVRNNLDELRRINTNVKKLAPIGATAP